MQDITGQYAIPLALPFSDVPPPYGRRRRPFVAGRRPKVNVFDLKGTHPAAAPVAGHAAMVARATKSRKIAKVVRAEDFGSDNRAWVRPHPLRRRWRLTLMACALFGAACIVATHVVDERQHAAGQGAVYSAAIAVAPMAAVAATQVAQTTGRPAEVAIVQVDRTAPVDDPVKGQATVAAQAASAVSAASRALQADRAPSAGAPVAVAMAIASDAVVAEAAVPDARPASSAGRKPAASAARSAAAKPAATSRGKQRVNEASPAQAATTSRGAATHAPRAAHAAIEPAAAPASSSADAVGMTAAEFAQWLAATRDTSRPAAVATDLTVELPSHTRLIGH
ncbi:serine protease [Burkholderia cenocepacia]|uniref:serine protease n=1 Tax=Burkholderia cenocepacia TaxID=95486 RepID=UPI001F090533|nr:serine protease [Burkholderia cenocepacia]MCO1394415.1 serine protease [Burkholderia cenocepacia]MCO1404769.1 serine protease [Burkholderia cenocepacia]UQN96301.1 serine protease [Burkholderia cenocepacia]UQO02732.1 serine protease [Burkholderia cenocepacia]UQP52891.1 serine protease [Burkholderia cenocepacia]